MATLMDARFEALRAQGFTGATSDMLLQWLQANGATSNALPDAWAEMLLSQGFLQPLRSDAWYQLLGDLGFEGNMNDRQLQFWLDGGGILPTVHQWFIENESVEFFGYIELLAAGSLTPRDDWQALYISNANNFVFLANDSGIGSGIATVKALGLSADLVWDGGDQSWQLNDPTFAAAVEAAVGTTVDVSIYKVPV